MLTNDGSLGAVVGVGVGGGGGSVGVGVGCAACGCVGVAVAGTLVAAAVVGDVGVVEAVEVTCAPRPPSLSGVAVTEGDG
jgi:hypothetical protein